MTKRKQKNDQLWNTLNVLISRSFSPPDDINAVYNELNLDRVKNHTSYELDYFYLSISSEIRYYIVGKCNEKA